MRKAILKRGAVTMYHGDGLAVMRRIRRTIDAVITDPPYGVANNNDFRRFSGGKKPSRHYDPIRGDDQAFDPSPLLNFPSVVLFGVNNYHDRLPPGSLFVWNKKRENQRGKFCADCEVAWHNRGRGVYLFSHVWNGFDRETERGGTLHPHQKPVALFSWILSRIPRPRVVFDPYAGTAPVAAACYLAGVEYIGAEIEREYFDLAVERIRALRRPPHQAAA